MGGKLRTLLAATTLLFGIPVLAEAAPKVVVSIKPVHSLVASIMKGVGEPELIVDGVASPHTYQMKPSEAQKLEAAEVVFWIGEDLEAFMEKPLETLAGKARVVELSEAPNLVKLPMREGGAFEAHDHAHDDHVTETETEHDHDHGHEEAHDHGGHGETDMHLWLSTDNARAIAAEIAKVLTEADPGNAQIYHKNLATLDAELDALTGEIQQIVAPVKDKPFIVFHDAYQYFEKQFGVAAAGSITVSPETLPGAQRIAEIQAKVKEVGAKCVFAEPQFEPKLIQVVLEGTDARSGTLDPEAGGLEKGENLYTELLKGIARSLRDCLGGEAK